MIKQEIQGQIFFVCEHDGLVTDNIDAHKCPHALIGNCLNCPINNSIAEKCRLSINIVDLDGYGNCVACGSHHVTSRRAKFTHAEVMSSEQCAPPRGVEMRHFLWGIYSRFRRFARTLMHATLPESSI